MQNSEGNGYFKKIFLSSNNDTCSLIIKAIFLSSVIHSIELY